MESTNKVMLGATNSETRLIGNPKINVEAALTDFYGDGVLGRYIRFGNEWVTELPAPSAAVLGRVIMNDEGEFSGVATKLLFCYRKADDTYAWRDLISGVDL